MNRKINLILKIATIPLVIFISVAMFAAPVPVRYTDPIHPTIVVMDNDVRVGEKVFMTVVDIPSGSDVSWELDNGTVLEGRSIEHSFGKSDIFPVSVKVTWGRSVGSANTTVAVRCCDTHECRTFLKPFKKVAFGAHGYTNDEIGYSVEINGGITLPRFVVDIQLRRSVGEFSFYCRLLNKTHSDIYELRTAMTTMGELEYHAEILAGDYWPDIPDPSHFSGVVKCHQGDCPELWISIIVEYDATDYLHGSP